MDNEITRHDIPQTVKDVLAVAVECGTADVFDIRQLVIKHKDNWRALIVELTMRAFNDRHQHPAVVRAAEKHWEAERFNGK